MADDEDNRIRATAFMSPMQQYGTSIQTLTNPDQELLKMELTFRSQVLDKDGIPVQIGEPLMNDKGVSSVIGQVQSIVNQNATMSNFTDKDIPMVMDFLADTISMDLMMNRIEYDIKSGSSRDKIVFTAAVSAFNTLKRALNNGERGFWKGSQQDIRQFIETGQKSGGLFGMFGWGKKAGSA